MKFVLFLLLGSISILTGNATTSQCTGKPTSSNTDLVMVQLMTRHGVRSWLQTFPGEPINASVWDKYGGYSVLTSAGVKQMTEFGKYFKSNYNKKLPSPFDPSLVKARSTDYNRTMTSVQSFLNGMFGANSIPLNATSRYIDNILSASAPCPRYAQLKAQMRNSTDYLKLVKEKSNFIQTMATYSGITGLDYYNMWQIADHVLVNDPNNLPITSWEKHYMEEIIKANDNTFYIDFVTVEMGMLVSGGLLNDIILNINNTISGDASYQFYIYGIHDNYMAGMQKLLGTSKHFVQPNFGSAFVFELRKDNCDNYFVKVLHKNSEYPERIELKDVKIKGCDTLCPLETFYQLLTDKVVTNYFTTACVAQ